MQYNMEIPKNKRKGKIKFDKDFLYTEHIINHKTIFQILHPIISMQKE